MPKTPIITAIIIVASLVLPQALTAQPPDRIVLGYSAAWFDETCPPQYYNFEAMTHLARAFLSPHPDGTIEVPKGYFNEKLETLARAHHVKLLLSLGGEAENADNWLSISRHADYRDRFLQQLDKLLADHHYDGFDIDWEPTALTDEDGAAYVSLLKALRAKFPDRTITTALPASEYWVSHFSWQDVCDNVDYVNVMVYVYSGGWGGRAAYASNLFPPGAYKPEPGYSADEGMRNIIENHHVPPAKLLFGVTFWASQFKVAHIGDTFPKNAPGMNSNLTYAQAMKLLHGGGYREFWDDKAAMPYLEQTAGDAKSVVCYENAESIRRKCERAKELKCAGVMIWHVGADRDGESTPLMDALAKASSVLPGH